MMGDALATVAIVPRERFSFAQRSLENVLAHTPRPFEMLYVDGGSPAHVRDYLRRQADRHEFRLIRTEHYVSPNTARNLAAAAVRTKYVVFIDNDALVSPGWLGPLVDCAEATGAWVVGPIYCEGEPMGSHWPRFGRWFAVSRSSRSNFTVRWFAWRPSNGSARSTRIC
jgi:glycosyltransferase involved in cell wall biosynthesis